MNKMGFNCGKPRLPLVELTEKNKQKIDNLIKDFNL